MNGLLGFWDFQQETGRPRIARAGEAAALVDGGVPVERVEGGIFGPYSAGFSEGSYLYTPRSECAALNIHGPKAQVSVVAWLQRHRKRYIQCEAIAGMWNETRKKRQYGLFLDLRIHNGADNVCGHVSATGGSTPGYPWCMDAALGFGYIPYFEWQCVAFTYDGSCVRAWLNGGLDARVGFNPYAYPYGLFDGGGDGADFTVGGVHQGGQMGNWFVGRLGGLAVYDRALGQDELLACTELLPHPPETPPSRPPMLI
jgi:hypothetical protein